MIRSTLLILSALIALSAATGDEVAKLSSPMTQMLLHDKLYTTIHTNVKHARGAYFSGRVVGKFEKTSGVGSYTGNFRGTSKGKNAHATFTYDVDGSCTSVGFNVKYGGKVSGKMSVKDKRVSVNARYTSDMHGTVHGKKVRGDCTGNAYFTMRRGMFYYRENGSTKMTIAGKPITAKYYATLNKNVVKVAVYGMYAGKKFFVKHAFSLNLLPLGLEMNPMMIKRNYGTVYVTVGGKTYTKKYDVKGMQLPKLQ